MTALTIHVHPDSGAVARAAADAVLRTARENLTNGDRCGIMLSGGSTPRAMYALLRASPPAEVELLRRVHWFIGDERKVPLDDERSNSGTAARELFEPLAIENQFRQVCLGDGPPWDSEPGRMESVLRSALRSPRSKIPSLHLVLLGMGADGHVASLFPGTPALEEETALFVRNRTPDDGFPVRDRITATYPLLNAAEDILLLVTGEEKAATVARVLVGDEALPAARLCCPSVQWLLDPAAASQLDQAIKSGNFTGSIVRHE